MQRNPCQNFNHRRSNPPVRHCPNCGEVVNKTITATRCAEEVHAKRRRNIDKYCVDCGMQLIK